MARLSGTSDEWYSENADAPRVVAAFDTDETMDYASGPVPLEHVIELRDDPDVSVWSTGYNQTLRDEAGIPGMAELKTKLGIDDPFVDRPDRMRLLERHIPDADHYFVVDDVDLSALEPAWEYWTPWDYAREVLGLDVGAGFEPRRSPLDTLEPVDPDDEPRTGRTGSDSG